MVFIHEDKGFGSLRVNRRSVNLRLAFFRHSCLVGNLGGRPTKENIGYFAVDEVPCEGRLYPSDRSGIGGSRRGVY